VVITDLDVESVAILETETASPFLIDRHGVLALPVSLEAV
jgi:hypothetical protein